MVSYFLFFKLVCFSLVGSYISYNFSSKIPTSLYDNLIIYRDEPPEPTAADEYVRIPTEDAGMVKQSGQIQRYTEGTICSSQPNGQCVLEFMNRQTVHQSPLYTCVHRQTSRELLVR